MTFPAHPSETHRNETQRSPEAPATGVADLLTGAAQLVARQLFPDPERRAERMGEVFIACERASRERPDDFRQALETGALESFLLPFARAELVSDTPGGPSGGWLGTFMDATGRPIEAPEDHVDSTDPEALETSRQGLARAESLARAEGNETLLRNLRWYRLRLEHRSYEAIAREEGRVAATVRTGVARARKFLLRVVHQLQEAQPAPLSGDAPAQVEPLRELWVKQDLEELERALERTRATHDHDPHWLNLAGLFAADRGRADEARAHFEQALVLADAPSVRGRVLNNLGNLVDDASSSSDPPSDASKGEARGYWLRAHQLVPSAPAPLVNLLAAASSRKDYPSAQHYLAEIAELLSSGRLRDDERDYLLRRLEHHPRLAWLRDTDAWRTGPVRWLRAARRAIVAVALGLLVGLGALLPSQAAAREATAPSPIRAAVWIPGVAADSEVVRIAGGEKGRGRGGDSMGKPARRSPELPRFAGDSMGRSGGGKPPRS